MTGEGKFFTSDQILALREERRNRQRIRDGDKNTKLKVLVEDREGAAGLGNYWEDYTEGGGGAGRIREVILNSDIGSVVVWGGDLGVVDANGADSGGSLCGVPETGGKVEGKNSEGRLVAEGGGVQSDSGSRYTTSPDLLGQEEGDSGGMGGIMAYI